MQYARLKMQGLVMVSDHYFLSVEFENAMHCLAPAAAPLFISFLAFAVHNCQE